jgi:hypothetical protein
MLKMVVSCVFSRARGIVQAYLRRLVVEGEMAAICEHPAGAFGYH